MYIRIKRIKGRDYGYLVQTHWQTKGPRQKVIAYLGKLIRPEKVNDVTFADFLGEETLTFLKENSFNAITEKLVAWELHKHNLTDEITYKSESLEMKKKACNSGN